VEAVGIGQLKIERSFDKDTRANKDQERPTATEYQGSPDMPLPPRPFHCLNDIAIR
jgi:hypothetical protein